MSDREISADGLTDSVDRNLTRSPEERSGAEAGRETASDSERETTESSWRLPTGTSGTSDESDLNQSSTDSQDLDLETSTGDSSCESLENVGGILLNTGYQYFRHSREEGERDRQRLAQVCSQCVGSSSMQYLTAQDRALDEWVASETSPLPPSRWQVLTALWDRQLGLRPNFVYEACGARNFIQRFFLQDALEGHAGCITTLHFNQSGTRLASSGDDQKVIVWDWMRGQPVLNFDSGHTDSVYQAKFLPNCGDSTLATSSFDGDVRVAYLLSEPLSCNYTKCVAKHRGGAYKLALEPDSPFHFLTSGEDAVVFAIDLRKRRPATKVVKVKNEMGKRVGLYTICVNPANTHQFATAGKDQFVRIYDRRKINLDENNGMLKKFCPHHLIDCDCRTSITCVVYSHDGTELLASYSDDDIYLFNSADNDGAEYVKKYKGHRNSVTIKSVNFYGPKSEFVVSGSDCGHIFLWDKSSCQVIQYMQGDRCSVSCVESHSYLPVLATSGLDHEVKIWAPTARTPSHLARLKYLMKNNKLERDQDHQHCFDLSDSSTFSLHLHHHARRGHGRSYGPRGAGVRYEDPDDSSTSSEE